MLNDPIKSISACWAQTRAETDNDRTADGRKIIQEVIQDLLKGEGCVSASRRLRTGSDAEFSVAADVAARAPTVMRQFRPSTANLTERMAILRALAAIDTIEVTGLAGLLFCWPELSRILRPRSAPVSSARQQGRLAPRLVRFQTGAEVDGMVAIVRHYAASQATAAAGDCRTSGRAGGSLRGSHFGEGESRR